MPTVRQFNSIKWVRAHPMATIQTEATWLSSRLPKVAKDWLSDKGWLQGVERVTTVNFRGALDSTVNDDDLKHLQGLRGLRELDLGLTQVTGAGFTHLKDLSALRTLYLYGAPVTDAGLQHLENLPSLQVLRLDTTEVPGIVIEF